MNVDETMLCDFSDMVRAARGQRANIRLRHFLEALSSEFEHINNVPLMTFIELVFSREKLHQETMQIVWRLGGLLERHVLNLQKHSPTNSKMVYQSFVFDGERAGMARVASYWVATQDHCATFGLQFLSGSIDKSRVHSYGVLSSCWADVSGIAWWGVPQDNPHHITFTNGFWTHG